MTAQTTDLFAKDGAAAPGTDPIKNTRQEAFCQLYAGIDADGKPVSATSAYMQAYGITDPNVAGASASRLLTNLIVQSRVRHLREKIAERIGIDRAAILIRRWEIANKGGQSPAARSNQLAALRDIERSLGFADPDPAATNNNFFGPVSNTQFNGPIRVTDPAAFALAAEALRAARERA